MDREILMRLALDEAARGLETGTNPRVGCVIAKNGRVIATGHHAVFGGPHAEINALRKAGRLARGAEMYVTLEPCAHTGKTGPCADAVAAAGIRTVHYAMQDPNPLVSGRGAKRLKALGVKTGSGLLADEARAQNQPFIKNVLQKKTYVTVKYAMTADGKIALSGGESKYITTPEARRAAKAERDRHDAVMAGTGTYLADDCLLDGLKKSPVKVIPDAGLRLPVTLKVFNSPGRKILFTARSRRVDRKKAGALEARGVEIVQTEATAAGLELESVMAELYKRNISSLMVEGGGKLLGSFFDANLPDRAVVFVAYKIFGGKNDICPVSGRGVGSVDRAREFRDVNVTAFRRELMLEGLFRRY